MFKALVGCVLSLCPLALAIAAESSFVGPPAPPRPIDRSEFSAAEWESWVDEAMSDDAELPTLIGGTVVNPADWPASPWVGNCSSTLIGPKVLITAAHCVSDGGQKTFSIGSARYTATCSHHPSYRSNSTADWALCLVGTAVSGVPVFESLPASAEEVGCAVGKTLTLSGYGCTRWGGGIDGQLRVGTAQVTACPNGNSHDIVTRASVALCSGDSGGGGYSSSSSATRKTIMNNSRSDTSVTSYMPSYGTAAFRDWALGWASSKNVKLCGLHADAAPCRGSSNGDPEPDPGTPPDCSVEFAAYESSLSLSATKFRELKACVVQ